MRGWGRVRTYVGDAVLRVRCLGTDGGWLTGEGKVIWTESWFNNLLLAGIRLIIIVKYSDLLVKLDWLLDAAPEVVLARGSSDYVKELALSDMVS